MSLLTALIILKPVYFCAIHIVFYTVISPLSSMFLNERGLDKEKAKPPLGNATALPKGKREPWTRRFGPLIHSFCVVGAYVSESNGSLQPGVWCADLINNTSPRNEWCKEKHQSQPGKVVRTSGGSPGEGVEASAVANILWQHQQMGSKLMQVKRPTGLGEIAPWLRALDALPKDPGGSQPFATRVPGNLML